MIIIKLNKIERKNKRKQQIQLNFIIMNHWALICNNKNNNYKKERENLKKYSDII